MLLWFQNEFVFENWAKTKETMTFWKKSSESLFPLFYLENLFLSKFLRLFSFCSIFKYKPILESQNHIYHACGQGLTQPVPGPGQTQNRGPPSISIHMSNMKGPGPLYIYMLFEDYLSFIEFFTPKNLFEVLCPGPLRAPGPRDFAPLAPLWVRPCMWVTDIHVWEP